MFAGKRWPSRLGALAMAVPLAGVALAGCGGSVGHRDAPAPAATATPAVAAHSCPESSMASGLALDPDVSGSLAPAQYSQAGDVQAALLYDGFVAGSRSVYRAASPTPTGDEVVECTDLQFRSDKGAAQFEKSYRALRQEAASLAQPVTPAPPVGRAETVAYLEKDQSFAKYAITGATVLEISAQQGSHFYTAAIAAPTPSTDEGVGLLRSMGVGQ